MEGILAGVNYLGFFRLVLEAESEAALTEAAVARRLNATLPVEPVTGEPFVWDPESRTLALPAKALELGFTIEPRTLP